MRAIFQRLPFATGCLVAGNVAFASTLLIPKGTVQACIGMVGFVLVCFALFSACWHAERSGQ